MSNFQSLKSHWQFWLCLAYTGLAIGPLHPFLVYDVQLVIGACVVPLTFSLTDLQKRSNRWLWLVIILGILSVLVPSYSLFYGVLVAVVLWLWESQIGKLTVLPALTLLTLSPVFQYITEVFSFESRLGLTRFAAQILQKIDPSVIAVGNVIRLNNGNDWQIDGACVGLNLLGLTLLLTYFLLAFFTEKQKFLLSNWTIIAFVLLTIVLNFVSNLIRIIVLVFLKIPPETSGHEVVGLLTALAYVVLPIYFLSSRGLFKLKILKGVFPLKFIENSTRVPVQPFLKQRTFRLHGLIFLLIALRGIGLIYQKSNAPISVQSIEKQGFTSQNLPNGVCQLRNDSTLIYLKSIPNFFTTEHSPMICWRGSGYVFKQIERVTVAQIPIYVGILVKDSSQIHTAWWFENESGFATTDQIEWRWRSITEGGNFRLVNVNAESRTAVVSRAEEWLFSNRKRVE
jgi:exosortase N